MVEEYLCDKIDFSLIFTLLLFTGTLNFTHCDFRAVLNVPYYINYIMYQPLSQAEMTFGTEMR